MGIIVDGEVIPSSIQSYMDTLCVKSCSTFDGRVKGTRLLLGRKRNAPIYVDTDTILIMSKAIREYDCCIINYLNIVDVEYQKQSTIIHFSDNSEIELEITQKRLVIQLNLCKELKCKIV